MPNLSIKDVPDALAEQLRQRAARNHRSLQGELMALLEESVAHEHRVAEPAAQYAAPPSPDALAVLLEKWDATQRAGRATLPVSHDEYVRRLDAVTAQVNPEFRAGDRLTREQANDRAYLRSLGI